MRFPRIGITAGDPAGIGPEIARKAMADRRVRAVCEPLFYGSQQPFAPGRAVRRCRPRGVRDDRARRARRAGRRHSRDRDGAHQQGGAGAGGVAVARAYGDACRADQRSERRDDVLVREAPGRAGDHSHSARERAGGADDRVGERHHRADQPGAAAIRHRASTPRACGAQPARRRAWHSRTRRDRCARARRGAKREQRASISRGRFRAIRSFCGRCAESSTRSSPAITIRA